jgi:hypothetical protein
LVFRRTSLAIVAWVLISALFLATQVLNSGTSVWIASAFQAATIVILTIMVVRYGVLVTAVAFVMAAYLDDFPLILSLSHWTAGTTNVTLAAVFALTGFGFYAARAGQPLFGTLESKK